MTPATLLTAKLTQSLWEDRVYSPTKLIPFTEEEGGFAPWLSSGPHKGQTRPWMEVWAKKNDENNDLRIYMEEMEKENVS